MGTGRGLALQQEIKEQEEKKTEQKKRDKINKKVDGNNERKLEPSS